MRYTIPGSLHYEPSDGFWHLGLGLNIAGQRLLLEVCIASSKDKTRVRRGSDGPIREIDLANEGQRNAFYDEIAAWVMSYFDVELDPFDGTVTKKIGFHP
jgi:hypothetical protein